MVKLIHEVRDPIHVFIKFDACERDVINSRIFQRLRHIHQLAMTYCLYPGATHKRFEHSLGVMDLAGRVYDVLTNNKNWAPQIADTLKEIDKNGARDYWRQVVRMAGLCHDIGHLPFSHAAEKELLPERWSHERLTVELIKSPEMVAIWDKERPQLNADDIAKVAVGPKHMRGTPFDPWVTLLSEIISGDSFGVDRIDYLLRDSHHTGVMYGKFDHYRLIDTLRILPKSEESPEPTIGIEAGGIHTAEALLLARYFMFIQVYLHPVRRIHDLHLKDFLIAHLGGKRLETDLDTFLSFTDNEVLSLMEKAKSSSTAIGHIHAQRILNRKYFKRLYERIPSDLDLHPEPGRVIYNKAVGEFGEDSVRHDSYNKDSTVQDFPVLYDNPIKIESAFSVSKVLETIPPLNIDYVFIDPALRDKGLKWLTKQNREDFLRKAQEEAHEGDKE